MSFISILVLCRIDPTVHDDRSLSKLVKMHGNCKLILRIVSHLPCHSHKKQYGFKGVGVLSVINQLIVDKFLNNFAEHWF